MTAPVIARRMEEENPGWLVIYCPATEEFVVIPRFDTPPLTFIADTRPAVVVRRMRKIERLAGVAAGLRKI